MQRGAHFGGRQQRRALLRPRDDGRQVAARDHALPCHARRVHRQAGRRVCSERGSDICISSYPARTETSFAAVQSSREVVTASAVLRAHLSRAASCGGSARAPDGRALMAGAFLRRSRGTQWTTESDRALLDECACAFRVWLRLRFAPWAWGSWWRAWAQAKEEQERACITFSALTPLHRPQQERGHRAICVPRPRTATHTQRAAAHEGHKSRQASTAPQAIWPTAGRDPPLGGMEFALIAAAERGRIELTATPICDHQRLPAHLQRHRTAGTRSPPGLTL